MDVLFTPEQQSKLLKTMQEIGSTKFADPSNPPTLQDAVKGRGEILKRYKPDAFNFLDPEVMYREHWEQYISYAALHEQSTSKRGTKRGDTTKRRGRAAKQLAKYLGRTPTTADLATTFPSLTQLDEKTCRIIDRDLERLVHA
ncbi:MAG TPA: hypothetical protein VGB98_21400 [Pyrinomonadaceae bacterium]